MQASEARTSALSTWVLVIVGALIGASLFSNGRGLVLGAALGYLFARLLDLQTQVEALQRRLRALDSARGAAAAPGTATPAPAPAPTATVAVPPPAMSAPPRMAAAPPAAGASETPAAARSSPPRPALLPPSRWQRALDDAKAWLRGGNPLARIGVVILFFGGAFLARYAAEHSLLPIELRLAALAAGAIGLLGFGWKLRQSRPLYAQILQGGGIAGLYLTVFAAARLYQLLPPGLALGVMVVVALASAVLAVAQNSLSLAVIGFAGGFLAPVLLSTGGGSHVALFSYYTVLNLGIFAVAWFRAWRWLNLVGFVFTFAITGLWRATAYQPAELASADFFLLLFGLLYVAVSVLFALRQPPQLKGYVSGTLVFGLPVVVATLHATLVREIAYAMAWSALGFGLFYLLLAWTLWRTRRDTLRLLAEAFAALGVIFASLAVPLAFDERAMALMWAVEGAGLLWLGVRQDRPLARAFALLLQLVAGLRYLAYLDTLQGEQLFLNGAWLASAALALSGLFSGYWLSRGTTLLRSHERYTPLLVTLWGTAWWFAGGLAELDRHMLPEWQAGAALVFLALSLWLLQALALRTAWPLLRRIALLLLPAALLLGLTVLAAAHPTAQGGWLGWPLLFAIAYAMLHRLDREPDTALYPAIAWLHATAAWALAVLLVWELRWQLSQSITGVWRDLPPGVVLALLLALLGAQSLRPSWPLARHADSYRGLVAVPLVAVVLLWTLAVNLGSDGDPGWLPYVPLLNPLDIAVALALLALARWALALRPAQRARLAAVDPRVALAAYAALVFLWLSAALVRALHHGLGTPITAQGIADSTLVQAALSIFWGLLGFGAMLLATRHGQRKLWMVGAGLMGMVVAKLFLVDLSGSGTLARVASFLSVGVLLLVTGYLSPLPPERAQAKPAEPIA